MTTTSVVIVSVRNGARERKWREGDPNESP